MLQLVSFQSLSSLGAPFLSFTKKFGAHFIFKNFIYLFSQLFLAAQGLGRLSLVVASGGFSSLWCTGFSLQWLLSLRSMDCRVHVGLLVAIHRLQTMGTVVVAQGLSRSSACGIFPDQGWNHVLRTARWILNYWATLSHLRETLRCLFLAFLYQ